jgi:hypothetical protein
MAEQIHEGFFRSIPVIGEMSEDAMLERVREMESEPDHVEPATDEEGLESWPFGGRPKPFQHTSHAFGYIAPAAPGGSDIMSIDLAGNIQPDVSLRGQRVTVRLDYMRIASYPGGGVHHILFDFYGENHLSVDIVESVHFNQTFRGREGESVGVIGYPVFVGMNVGSEGIAFKCFTVNVKNENDERILQALDSDVVQGGLKLMNTAQPALAPLSNIAVGLTKALASRNKNVAVQSFYMGLDFSNIATRAKLAEGSYVAVQVPDAAQWNWAEWGYDPARGRVVNRADAGRLVPFNYITFSVSRFGG